MRQVMLNVMLIMIHKLIYVNIIESVYLKIQFFFFLNQNKTNSKFFSHYYG
jgi:hypothetical protein